MEDSTRKSVCVCVCVCVCDWVNMMYSRNWHNTANQPYTNTKRKEKKRKRKKTERSGSTRESEIKNSKKWFQMELLEIDILEVGTPTAKNKISGMTLGCMMRSMRPLEVRKSRHWLEKVWLDCRSGYYQNDSRDECFSPVLGFLFFYI